MWTAAAVFVLSMLAGIARSISVGHLLPPVGVEYTTELDGLIQAHGGAALPKVRSAAKIDFDNEMAVKRLLQSAREAGNQEDIEWALVALVRLKPEDVQIRNELVAAMLEQGRAAEAFTQARFVIWLTPDSPEAHCNLGAALTLLDQPQQAAMAYRRALELDPGSETARRGLESSSGGS